MKKIMTLTVLAGILTFAATGAWADGPFPQIMTNGALGPAGSVTPNSTTGEFEIYNAINLLLNTNYTNNAQVDSLEYRGDPSTWMQTNDGGYAVIGLGAGATNSLEVFNAATPNTLINPLGGGFMGDGATGDGTSGNGYVGTASVIPVGTQFGFALSQYYNHVTTVYSSNSSANFDGVDHMLVYNLSQLAGTQMYIWDPNTHTEQLVTLNNPYLLAFEDIAELDPLTGAPSDVDYNDLIVLEDGATPYTPNSNPVPEPKTLALFFTGLISMGGFALRRKFLFTK